MLTYFMPQIFNNVAGVSVIIILFLCGCLSVCLCVIIGQKVDQAGGRTKSNF